MTTLFGFILFCCVAWWWVRGYAFAAFIVTMAVCGLVAIGAGETTASSYPERFAIVIGLAWLPWLIRTQILWTRSKRIARASEQVWSQPTSYPRIPR